MCTCFAFIFKRKATILRRQDKVYCPLGAALFNLEPRSTYLLANQQIKCLFHDLLDTKSIYVSHGKKLDIIIL